MQNKIGMNMLLWSTHVTPEHIPVFEFLAECGYDGVEIPIGVQSEEELGVMAEACDRLGLERTSSAFVGLDTNPISADASIRAAAITNLKAAIDGARTIGAGIVVGGIYQAHKYFTGAAPTAPEWEWAAEYLRECGDYAAQFDIKLGLEFLNRFEAFLINTSADCARMVEAVGLPNVGVHYDTHHANIEDPMIRDSITAVHPVMNHVHLSESHRGTLGTGQVDWETTFSSLHEVGYDGWLVIEAFGTYDPGLASAANVWRNAFESPEQLVRDGIEFIRSNL